MNVLIYSIKHLNVCITYQHFWAYILLNRVMCHDQERNISFFVVCIFPFKREYGSKFIELYNMFPPIQVNIKGKAYFHKRYY